MSPSAEADDDLEDSMTPEERRSRHRLDRHSSSALLVLAAGLLDVAVGPSRI